MKNAATFSFKIPIDNTKGIVQGLKTLTAFDVLVGVPAQKNRRQGEPGSTKRNKVKGQVSTKVNNAVIAYVMNNGDPARNIPARPTLQPGIKDAQSNIEKYMKGAGQAGIDGDVLRMEKNLDAVGLSAQNAVRKRINSNTPPPLAPATLAARRRRGRTGTRTLYDTGQYLSSNTYVLRKKK